MGPSGSEWLDFEHAEALAVGAAERVAALLGEAISRRAQASLVLAGGSTPEATYRHLSLLPVDWQRVWIFWSDERCVDAGEAGSRTFRIEGERGAAAAAVAYEGTLRSVLTGRPWPRFDVSLLGIGSDGHTASLFPDDLSPAPDSEYRWVRPARGPAPHPERVTLTLGALASSERIIFLISGRSKAEIVIRLRAGGEADLPAARLERAARSVTWMLDSSAWDRVAP
jgi:6-phosphogluconolactonase